MTHFQHMILAVPHLHANEDVIRFAVELAQQHNARLTLLGVTDEIEKAYESWLSTKLPQNLLQDMSDKQHFKLKERVDWIRQSYAKVDCVVRQGIPFVELIKEVQEKQADLLILEAVSTAHVGKRFLGSTTKHVLRKCPCPVLSVRGGHPPKKILAAVDVFSSPGSDKAGLNRKILQFAWGLSHQKSAHLEILYAAEAPDVQTLSAWGVEMDHIMHGMSETQRTQIHGMLSRLVEECVPMTSEVGLSVIEGKPREVIPTFVKDNEFDLVVMGTVCRTGIKGFLIGNTAEQIFSEVPCSILALKPDGFQSTVE